MNDTERRTTRRSRTIKKGRAFFSDFAAALDCTVRDVSDGGARLKFDSPYQGPDFINLQIGAGDFAEPPRQAKVRWRKGNEVGIKYLDHS